MESDLIKGGKTGWPPGLLQDDNSRLSKWFASRLDARYIVRRNINEMHMPRTQSIPMDGTDNTDYLRNRSSVYGEGR